MIKKYYIKDQELNELERQSLEAITNRLDALYGKLALKGKADIVFALEESDVIQEPKKVDWLYVTSTLIAIFGFLLITLFEK